MYGTMQLACDKPKEIENPHPNNFIEAFDNIEDIINTTKFSKNEMNNVWKPNMSSATNTEINTAENSLLPPEEEIIGYAIDDQMNLYAFVEFKNSSPKGMTDTNNDGNPDGWLMYKLTEQAKQEFYNKFTGPMDQTTTSIFINNYMKEKYGTENVRSGKTALPFEPNITVCSDAVVEIKGQNIAIMYTAFPENKTDSNTNTDEQIINDYMTNYGLTYSIFAKTIPTNTTRKQTITMHKTDKNEIQAKLQ